MKSSISWRALLEGVESVASRVNGQSNVLSSLDRETIDSLLKSYIPNRKDYDQYICFSEKGFTKNLVRSFGTTCNIIVMCWSPNQGSSVHGHEGSNCFVKILQGSLREQISSYPKNYFTSMKNHKTGLLNSSSVTYIDDSVGVHQVTNIDSKEPAISLHIYLPAYKTSRIFELDANETFISSNLVDLTFENLKSQ